MDNFIRLIEKNYCYESTRSKPLMIVGDTGVGKSMFCEVFKKIYSEKRTLKEEKVSTINIAGLEPNLILSELFGHEQGAFTGARKAKEGLFEIADGGLVVIEEIGELSHPDQAKLLTFIEDGYFYRVGGLERKHANILIIASTNKPKEAFRSDFWSRFFQFYIPPLYKRRMDVLYYFSVLFDDLFRSLNLTEIVGFLSYHWPGNVREIENVGSLMRWYDDFRQGMSKNISRSGKDYCMSCLFTAKEYSPFRFSTFPYSPLSKDFLEGLWKYGVNYREIDYAIKRVGFSDVRASIVLELPLINMGNLENEFWEKPGLRRILPVRDIDQLHLGLCELAKLFGFEREGEIAKNLLDIKEGDREDLVQSPNSFEYDETLQKVHEGILHYRMAGQVAAECKTEVFNKNKSLSDMCQGIIENISSGEVTDEELEDLKCRLKMEAYQKVLLKTGGNYAKAARKLNMPETTLKRRIKKFEEQFQPNMAANTDDNIQ